MFTHTHTTHNTQSCSQIDHLSLSLSLQGLIARGDHHGSLVEKDEHSLSSQPAHPSLQLPTKQPPPHHMMTSSISDDHMQPQQTRSVRPIQAHDSHVTSSTLNHHHHHHQQQQRHSGSTSGSSSCTSESHGSHVIKQQQHQLVVPAPESMFLAEACSLLGHVFKSEAHIGTDLKRTGLVFN